MLSIRRSDTVYLIFLTIFLASVLFWVGVGPARAAKPVCGDGICQGNESKTCPEDCGGGGGGGTIPVAVTFRNAGGSPDRLMSDGLGDYIHKVDKVNTGIGSSGNFFMKLTKGNQPAIRTLFLDFSDCDASECNLPFLGGSGFSVGPANMRTTGVNLREMDIDGDPSGDLSLMVSFNLTSVGGGLWLLMFGPPNVWVNADCPGSTEISVTRTGADTWEIEADPDGLACLLEELSPSELILSGLYHMPFKITVQEK